MTLTPTAVSRDTEGAGVICAEGKGDWYTGDFWVLCANYYSLSVRFGFGFADRKNGPVSWEFGAITKTSTKDTLAIVPNLQGAALRKSHLNSKISSTTLIWVSLSRIPNVLQSRAKQRSQEASFPTKSFTVKNYRKGYCPTFAPFPKSAVPCKVIFQLEMYHDSFMAHD